MPKLNGQLGTPLDASMPSILLSCRWSLTDAMAGGEAVMTVLTGYVGEGCPFTFKIHAEDGSVVATVQGKAGANCCSAPWKIPAKTKGKHFFLAEASSVGINGRSDTLLVRDQVALGPVEIVDSKGKAMQKVPLGQATHWKAKMPGVPDGTPFSWSILCHQDAAHRTLVASGKGEVQQGAGEVVWESHYPFLQQDKKSDEQLKQTSEKYKDAHFQAVFSCLGASSKSAELLAKTSIGLLFKGGSGKRKLTLPDGSSKELTLDEEGNAIEPGELPIGVSRIERVPGPSTK
ncbi:MAG: hypothetical protein IPK50_05730 [Fibrobacterota bacterium]|nr:hypothetical protein [Fibrobacterota bacterium]QQS06395.1 MAG: hypothetical protein IPK50_05730 [Fibrobacterota bacterium]